MQEHLRGTEPIAPVRASCKPIVKWAGGKHWLVPIIAPGIYERLAVTHGRYFEPFLGGGAIALHLGLPGMVLSDVCQPLIEMYKAVCRAPGPVSWSLKTMVETGIDEQTYLMIRAAAYRSPIRAAARFIYLNKVGYNGLYRENKSGKYNVPFGRASNGKRSFPSKEHLKEVARALADAELRQADFREVIAETSKGDVLYADPPYDGTFSKYASGGFEIDDQVDLAQALREAHERGVAVIASNSDTARVRDLYDWAFVTPVTERHNIGATAARRGKKAAVLIVSDETILKGS